MVIQLDPFEIGRETEEDRRARALLEEAQNDLQAIEPIELPPALSEQAEEARQLGDAMRARGPVEPPPGSHTFGVGRVRSPSSFDAQRVTPASAPARNPERVRAAIAAARRRPSVLFPEDPSQAYGSTTAVQATPGMRDNAEIFGRQSSDGATSLGTPWYLPEEEQEAFGFAEDGDPTLSEQQPTPARPRLRELMEARRGSAPQKTDGPVEKPEAYDHTGADVADAIATPFRAIAAGLRGAAGRPSSNRPTFGERSRQEELRRLLQRRREMSDARSQADAEQRARILQRRQALQERQQSFREEDATRRADRQDRAADDLSQYRDRMAGAREQSAEAQAEASRARAALTAASRARADELREVDSDISNQLRTAYVDMVQQLNTLGDTTVTVPEDINTLSGEVVRDMLRRLPHVTLGRRGTGRRRVGGGGGPSIPESFRPNDPNRAAQWRQLTRSQRGRAILEDGAGGDIEEGRVGLIPGVTGDANLVSTPEARSFRDGFAETGAAMDAIGILEGVAQRYGTQAVIDPRIAAEIAPQLMIMRGIATELQHTGTINEGEAPLINRAIPDPSNLQGMTIGDIERSVRAWRAALESRVLRRAQSMGVDGAGIAELRRALRSMAGGGGRSSGGSSPPVIIVERNGQRRRVPADRWPGGGVGTAHDGWERVQ